MALVPCRECGKEVSDEAKTCPYCGIRTPSKARRKRKFIITAVIILVIVGLSAWGYHKVNQPVVAADGTPVPTPKIQKTLPVKEQIVQKDYKEKIKEMLDSGQSVHEVSKRTGIRMDEVRKIKKESEAKK